MIEKITLDFLSSKLKVPVCLEVPVNQPKKYVVIEKTGSSRKNHLMTATIAVQSIAPSMFEASQLNEEAKKTMDLLITLEGITKAELETDYNFTNIKTKQYRYQAVYQVTHY